MGVEHGFMQKAGSWYSYNGERIGQGRDNVRNYLKENTKVAVELESTLRDKLLTKNIVAETDPVE